MKAASEDGSNTLIETLYNENQISTKKFSIQLESTDGDSVLIIGEPDSTYYTGDIAYGDVIQATSTGIFGHKTYALTLYHSYYVLCLNMNVCNCKDCVSHSTLKPHTHTLLLLSLAFPFPMCAKHPRGTLSSTISTSLFVILLLNAYIHRNVVHTIHGFLVFIR